jgi:KUP system potassium uptake protein
MHRPVRPGRELALAALGALGVVYGDIGTSPLYAIKECLAWDPEGKLSPHAVIPILPNVLGVLSLVFWALVLVICIKYLAFVLRADNHGEGGILALSALLQHRHARRLAVPMLLGVFGTGLLFGDGVITPAISVLGAIEGLSQRSHALTVLVVPITVAILLGLFVVQRHGTGRIGLAFGPVMLIWFIAIGAIGLRWIVVSPVVLRAVNPAYAASFLASHGVMGFLMLGLVALAITGAEALYADLGHFGKQPIRLAWFAVAMPGLLLNYFGQGALLLAHEPGTIKNPFYASVQGPLLIPMLVLATMAAIIASQALIAGVFSITHQAMQLGLWPRVTVVHTSPRIAGQIYLPEMNWLLMAGCIAVVLGFRSSSGLAGAYGVAVTGTMVITTLLLYGVCRSIWKYSRPRALALVVPFLTIDLAFFAASTAKIADGGWFPLAIAISVFAVMTTWCRGRTELAQIMDAASVPEELFLADLAATQSRRVRGTAVFMSSTPAGIPNVLLHHLKHNQVLHEQVVLLTIEIENVPWVDSARTLEVRDLANGLVRIVARFGFMQRPDVPKLLERCASKGIVAAPMATTFYLGRETLLTDGTTRFARWRKLLFAFLSRNARSPTELFNLPPNRVVELGTQIQI